MKTFKPKVVKRPKNILQNKAFKIAKCRMGVPVVSVELTDDMLKDLFKAAKDECELIILSRNARSLKSIETFKKLWIEKFFNALCLEALSRVRGKFSGKLPIPDSEIMLDSESLRIDSQKEIETLRSLLHYAIESRTNQSKKQQS